MLNKLKSTLKFIYNHPFNRNQKLASLFRFLSWQIHSRISPRPMIYSYTENSKIFIRKGLAAATGNLYCGLMEFEEMSFLLHFLRSEDVFLDVGANVGAFSILASGEIGAFSIVIEPVPVTFSHLGDNIKLNGIEQKVALHNIGLGASKGHINFTKDYDALNHVATKYDHDTIEVLMDTVDNIVNKTPLLIKIDVEGYETEVLNGAEVTLRNPDLKAVIIELNGSGAKFGYDEKLLHDKLLDLGFLAYKYDPYTRTLVAVPSFGNHNTLYLRDIEFVKTRLRSARKIRVRNKEI